MPLKFVYTDIFLIKYVIAFYGAGNLYFLIISLYNLIFIDLIKYLFISML